MVGVGHNIDQQTVEGGSPHEPSAQALPPMQMGKLDCVPTVAQRVRDATKGVREFVPVITIQDAIPPEKDPYGRCTRQERIPVGMFPKQVREFVISREDDHASKMAVLGVWRSASLAFQKAYYPEAYPDKASDGGDAEDSEDDSAVPELVSFSSDVDDAGI
jgi:hypothetical protein